MIVTHSNCCIDCWIENEGGNSHGPPALKFRFGLMGLWDGLPPSWSPISFLQIWALIYKSYLENNNNNSSYSAIDMRITYFYYIYFILELFNFFNPHLKINFTKRHSNWGSFSHLNISNKWIISLICSIYVINTNDL